MLRKMTRALAQDTARKMAAADLYETTWMKYGLSLLIGRTDAAKLANGFYHTYVEYYAIEA